MKNGAVAAILVVAILAGSGVGYFAGTYQRATLTSTTTSYQLEFIQESNCPYGSWLVPWGVVVGHQTVVQPSNATLPLSYATSRTTSNSTYSTILFSLPKGTYTYAILPKSMLGQEQSGNVTVDGSNVVVQVYIFVTSMGCSSTTTVAQSSTSQSNTYLTSCVITGVGGFEFRVVSDSTGALVSGETIKAVDKVGCNAENQVVYLDTFSESQEGGGWLAPDWPSGATPAGGLSFIISYQGETYNFTTDIPPVGMNCATFHIPSGVVSSTTVMNGNCS